MSLRDPRGMIEKEVYMGAGLAPHRDKVLKPINVDLMGGSRFGEWLKKSCNECKATYKGKAPRLLSHPYTFKTELEKFTGTKLQHLPKFKMFSCDEFYYFYDCDFNNDEDMKNLCVLFPIRKFNIRVTEAEICGYEHLSESESDSESESESDSESESES